MTTAPLKQLQGRVEELEESVQALQKSLEETRMDLRLLESILPSVSEKGNRTALESNWVSRKFIDLVDLLKTQLGGTLSKFVAERPKENDDGKVEP